MMNLLELNLRAVGAGLLRLKSLAGEVRSPHGKRRIEPWMQTELVSNVALLPAIATNFAVEVRLALAGLTPARPHGFDQRYLVLLGWGFLAPLVWGFSARRLPVLLDWNAKIPCNR
jgi:hypothetical protein